MDHDSNLVKARSSIVWMLAIVTAFGAVWWIEKESGRALIEPAGPKPAASAPMAAAAPASAPHAPVVATLKASPDLPASLPAPRELTADEKAAARVAWAYFEKNVDPATGLAHSVAGFPSTTMWDSASYLLALLAARDLGLVDAKGFDARMAKALDALGRIPLHANQLPNKSYDTRTLRMTDYRNEPSEGGIGWSAIDLGRLLVPLNAVVWQHPKHTEAARRVIARWDTRALARNGQLFGMLAHGSAPQLVQEGRLGYEQYAARTLALMGLDVTEALDWQRHLQVLKVDGVDVPSDARDPASGALNYVTSEPYMLAGLEFGWTGAGTDYAWRVYRAQRARADRTGTPTAVSEDHVDQAPFFVYNTVATAGKPWATVTDQGADAAKLRTLSTKAAFAWYALWRDDYGAKLVAAVKDLQDPQQGWYAGRYEEGGQPNKALAANTNAVVLESLAYIARGPVLRWRQTEVAR